MDLLGYQDIKKVNNITTKVYYFTCPHCCTLHTIIKDSEVKMQNLLLCEVCRNNLFSKISYPEDVELQLIEV